MRFHEAIGLLECALGDDHPRLVPTLIEMAELLTKKVGFRVALKETMKIILKNIILATAPLFVFMCRSHNVFIQFNHCRYFFPNTLSYLVVIRTRLYYQ